MSGSDHHSLWAYLATLGAIVILVLAAVWVCVTVDAETHLAQIVAALGFIGAAISGLIGVIGTFRPKGSPVAETQTGDVNVK